MEATSDGLLSGKALSDLSRQNLEQLTALGQTDIADLSRREFERQHALCSGADAGDSSPSTGLTREQHELNLRDGLDKARSPMTGAEFRQQQALGTSPELGSQTRAPSYEEFLAAHYPHLLQQEENQNEKRQQEQLQQQQTEVPPSEEELLRLQALQEFGRSQMPAVADKDHEGLLVKTIEHYTFADGEDHVNFYVHFDKDLFPGAAAFIHENQVNVVSRATSLDIRLQDVPVSEKNTGLLAEWRLSLSPLFSRVEYSLTSHKVRNGKLSIKLFKSKNGQWKKGVKYS